MAAEPHSLSSTFRLADGHRDKDMTRPKDRQPDLTQLRPIERARERPAVDGR